MSLAALTTHKFTVLLLLALFTLLVVVSLVLFSPVMHSHVGHMLLTSVPDMLFGHY